ncbi:MAG: acyltransferase [Solobacterium sp.]|nr:acyltransferase [Solobacterium sp.]
MAELRERYDNLDGLRVISCLAIIGMHIRVNGHYEIGENAIEIVGSWTHLVPLFLMISGFGMFCGYYEKCKSGEIDLNIFYTNRYKKILPFFTTLILVDVMMDRTFAHVIEGITEATLVFGLLPNNNPSVIGVSWTLGVIFLFYMLFPFFVYLCWTKKRAWASFAASIVLSIFCANYFFSDSFVVEGFSDRHNFLYCAPFFIGGGTAYLNRDTIKRCISRHRCLCFAGCASLIFFWYVIPNEINNFDTMMLKNLILFLPWLMYAITVDSKILSNKVMKYLSGISLELYLAQMVIFRFVEKAKCLYLFGRGWTSFVAVWILVVAGLIAFVELWKWVSQVVFKIFTQVGTRY